MCFEQKLHDLKCFSVPSGSARMAKQPFKTLIISKNPSTNTVLPSLLKQIFDDTMFFFSQEFTICFSFRCSWRNGFEYICHKMDL